MNNYANSHQYLLNCQVIAVFKQHKTTEDIRAVLKTKPNSEALLKLAAAHYQLLVLGQQQTPQPGKTFLEYWREAVAMIGAEYFYLPANFNIHSARLWQMQPKAESSADAALLDNNSGHYTLLGLMRCMHNLAFYEQSIAPLTLKHFLCVHEARTSVKELINGLLSCYSSWPDLANLPTPQECQNHE